MFTYAYRFTFAAAHELPGTADDHPCHNLHGHTWRVVVTYRGAALTPLGTVEGAVEGGAALAWYVNEVIQGRNLSDVLRDDATPEHVARHLFMVAKSIGTLPHSVTVTIEQESSTYDEQD